MLTEEFEEEERKIWPFGMARAYAWLGDANQAFHFLEETIETEPGQLGGLATMPLFRKLHSDRRWHPFLERTGQTPEQVAAFEFNVRAPD